MKFDLIFSRNETGTFKKVIDKDQPCIEAGTANEDISVISKAGDEVKTCQSSSGKVLYPINVGDNITVQREENGTRIVKCYKVVEITDTEVIGGPCD